jgi:hypothetical protein
MKFLVCSWANNDRSGECGYSFQCVTSSGERANFPSVIAKKLIEINCILDSELEAPSSYNNIQEIKFSIKPGANPAVSTAISNKFGPTPTWPIIFVKTSGGSFDRQKFIDKLNSILSLLQEQRTGTSPTQQPPVPLFDAALERQESSIRQVQNTLLQQAPSLHLEPASTQQPPFFEHKTPPKRQLTNTERYNTLLKKIEQLPKNDSSNALKKMVIKMISGRGIDEGFCYKNPITQELIDNPVTLASTGQTYDRESLIEHMKKSPLSIRNRCPFTREPLNVTVDDVLKMKVTFLVQTQIRSQLTKYEKKLGALQKQQDETYPSQEPPVVDSTTFSP